MRLSGTGRIGIAPGDFIRDGISEYDEFRQYSLPAGVSSTGICDSATRTTLFDTISKP